MPLVLTDTYPVPLGIEDQTMSGVAVHANMIEMLFQEWFLTEQSDISQAILIAAFAILTTVMLAQLRWRFYFPCDSPFYCIVDYGCITFR